MNCVDLSTYLSEKEHDDLIWLNKKDMTINKSQATVNPEELPDSENCYIKLSLYKELLRERNELEQKNRELMHNNDVLMMRKYTGV